MTKAQIQRNYREIVKLKYRHHIAISNFKYNADLKKQFWLFSESYCTIAVVLITCVSYTNKNMFKLSQIIHQTFSIICSEVLRYIYVWKSCNLL